MFIYQRVYGILCFVFFNAFLVVLEKYGRLTFRSHTRISPELTSTYNITHADGNCFISRSSANIRGATTQLHSQPNRLQGTVLVLSYLVIVVLTQSLESGIVLPNNQCLKNVSKPPASCLLVVSPGWCFIPIIHRSLETSMTLHPFVAMSGAHVWRKRRHDSISLREGRCVQGPKPGGLMIFLQIHA